MQTTDTQTYNAALKALAQQIGGEHSPSSILLEFMSGRQLMAIIDYTQTGEDAKHYTRIAAEMVKTIVTMPETYDQDGKGDDAIVYLHYFLGGNDWYITEKDCDPDGDGQIQAFGLANLWGGYPELGYISIKELIDANVELDLYWHPKSVGEVRAEIEARRA